MIWTYIVLLENLQGSRVSSMRSTQTWIAFRKPVLLGRCIPMI